MPRISQHQTEQGQAVTGQELDPLAGAEKGGKPVQGAEILIQNVEPYQARGERHNQDRQDGNLAKRDEAPQFDIEQECESEAEKELDGHCDRHEFERDPQGVGKAIIIEKVEVVRQADIARRRGAAERVCVGADVERVEERI
ncbi:MAG: hypothetical protein E6G89_03635 [Alphaproteobacteria bacterium]|nr:MAG: hypothetical protein E6G89_03635 [Alphaproteobacteria bacterium]